MKKEIGHKLLWVGLCLLSANVTHAHLTYTGRDFGAFNGQTNGAVTITNAVVTGNYGWADAADGILGDSHHGRAFRFHLDGPAFVSLSVSANPTATATSIGGLIPAFSIYAGLAAVAPFAPTQTTNAASADHDGTAASLAWRTWWVQQNIDPTATDEGPTDGCWNAVGDFKIGGDGDLAGDFAQLSTLTYKCSAAATMGANSVKGSFALPAGDYTIIIGGNDPANKTAGTGTSPHGIAATLSVAPTPILSIAPKVFVPKPTGISTNWVLESAGAVDATTWTKVVTTTVHVDGQAGVVLDSGASQQFFRFTLVP